MPELWLKDKKVLSFKEEKGMAADVKKVEDESLLPLCLKKDCSAEKLNEFFLRRQLPGNREGLDEMKDEFGTAWLIQNNRLSLSDQYWVRYEMEDWRKINFFDNFYSRDIGDMAFLPWTVPHKKIKNNSPDMTTNGLLRKRWKQDQKTRKSCLIKAGSRATHQEPLSEVLVSVLLEQLNVIPFVKYDLCVEGVTLCSICENFIDHDHDFIPVSDIYHDEPRGDEKIYDHILRMCDKYEVPGMKEFLDSMIFIDRITGNEDRNLGNIGFIRDLNTMKITGPAPLFDFGAAYWSSGKINDAVRSKAFGDVEKAVFRRMEKKCDLSRVLKGTGYVHCIKTYPRISEEKKNNLVEAIGKRNRMLLQRRGRDEMSI